MPTKKTIVIGFGKVGDDVVRQYRDDDTSVTEEWRANHGASIYGVAIAPSGSVVAVGLRSGNVTTRAFSATGSQVWEADHGANLFAVAVADDASGLIVTGGEVSSSVTTRAYSSSGAELWTANHGATVRGIAINDHSVYTVGDANSGQTLRCYNKTTGSLRWSASYSSTLYSVAVHELRLYVCGGGNPKVWALDLNSDPDTPPTPAWSNNSSTTSLFTICVDKREGGPIMAGGARIWSFNAQSGSSGQWPSISATTRSLAITEAGDYFVGVSGVSSNQARRYAVYTGSNVLWTTYNSSSAPVNSVAWRNVEISNDLSSNAPSIALGLSLGAALTGMAHGAAGIPLGVALALPTVAGGEIVLPPEEVSRFYLRLFHPTLGALDAPLAEIQCKRRLGQSTWMSVRIPSWSAELEQAVSGSVGSLMLIQAAGPIGGDGEFLRAVLTDVVIEREPYRSSIRLTGRVQTPYYTAQTRTINDVRRRGQAGDRRMARARIDPLLRPNDIIVDAGESWRVGAISYRIGPESGWMDIEEDA